VLENCELAIGAFISCPVAFRGFAKERWTRRGAIERMNSRLKEQLCLERHRARGLKRITIHALLSIITMLLTALVALRQNRLQKARCITMLAR
jgi:hypothetical protein